MTSPPGVPDPSVPDRGADPAPEPVSRPAGVGAVSVLADEQRRGLYEFTRRAHRPVTREEAAADAGVSAKLAAFHLDKLVAAGLLSARYENPGGIRRVGRKPKVYEPAAGDIRISIPERRPDLMAEILVDAALAPEPGEDARTAALRTAARHGRDAGAAQRARSRPGRLGPERSASAAEHLVEQYGFEPRRTAPTRLELLNCPFHPLAARAGEFVCGLNHAFLCGALEGLGTSGIEAVPAPGRGPCCVEFRETPRGDGT